MSDNTVLLTVLMMVIAMAIAPGMAIAEDPPFDPEDVEIASINGEDPDQSNDFPISYNDTLQIELSGVEEFDRSVAVEIGGAVVSHMDNPDQELRPHSDSEVTTGQQTLKIVYEERGERTVIAETQVTVTDVDLEQDDGETDTEIDPTDIELSSINGEDPDQVNELEISHGEQLRIELDGVEEFDRLVLVEIGGAAVGYMEEPAQEIRPRSDSNVTTGRQTMKIVHVHRGDRTVIAESDVDVTAVQLDSEENGREALDFDPENVEIATIQGEDAGQINEISVTYSDEIAIELEGTDATDLFARVELDGVHIGSLSEGENSFRPREGREISEGEQTLALVRERNGERIVIAETRVSVTDVDLTRDDPKDLGFDPADVSIATINGHEPDDVSLALRYNETIAIELDGIDATEQSLAVTLDGTTIGSLPEGENEFRPRTDSEITTGEHTMEIRARQAGKRPIVAETTVTVTEVQLDRDDDRERRPEFDPEAVSIVSVNGESADQRNELRLEHGSTVAIELEGADVPERGFVIEIGGDVVGILESSGESVRVRSNSDVSEGAQTLAVVWRDEGNRTVLAETEVDVTAVNLDERPPDIDPETVDLEIVSVNGQPADGVVVTEHDLRAETPIEMEVEGLSETELQPSIRYKGETLPPTMDSFTIEGDRISLEHLPRVEDGETATLELVTQTGAEEFHVFDSVEIEYRHVEEGDSDGGGGGIMNSIMKFLGGGDDSSSNEDEGGNGTDSDDESVTDDESVNDGESDSSEDDGGIISIIRGLFE